MFEYYPKYPQPFSLAQAIALDPVVAWDEIARLNNSLSHLKRSQDELRECLLQQDDSELDQALKENEITIASQDERIFMLKLALTHHGHAVHSKQTPQPTSHSQLASNSSNGLEDDTTYPAASSAIRETSEAGELENGVYL